MTELEMTTEAEVGWLGLPEAFFNRPMPGS